MMADVSFLFAGHRWHPLGCGALWWPAQGALLVADLHLEKASWLAARGQPLPPWDSLETLERLAAALAATGARRVYALGDSFHDRDGAARLPADARALLRRMMERAEWTWVGGNHDGLSGGALGGWTADEAVLDGVVLRHAAEAGEARPEVSGHWHPKVRLALRTGRQVSRACFALGPGKLVLPAYGAFTGGLSIGDPALAAALRGPVTGLVPTSRGLLRVPARAA